MLLDLNKLHGPREHIERTLPGSAFDPQDDDYRVAAPVELWMDIQKLGGSAYGVSGRLRAQLEVECSRCVDPYAVFLDASFELRYVSQAENTGEGELEVAEDDLTTAYHREGMLDVIEMLREQFVLALPMKPLCTDACRGLCPQCGANLNKTLCDCAPKWEDPRLAPLKSLLTRDKEN